MNRSPSGEEYVAEPNLNKDGVGCYCEVVYAFNIGGNTGWSHVYTFNTGINTGWSYGICI